MNPPSGIERCYRLLLRLYPKDFLAAHGADMLELFRDGWRRRARGGYRQLVLHSVQLVADVVHAAAAVRFDKLAEKKGRRFGVQGQGTRLPRNREEGPLPGLAQDLRFALRGMRSSPLVLICVLATLALGVAMNVVMLGIVDRALVSPPPGIRDPDRVVQLKFEGVDAAGTKFSMSTTSFPIFRLLRTLGTFDGVAAERVEEMTFGLGGELAKVSVSAVSSNYFDVMGTPLERGSFALREMSAEQVAVISHALWKRSFGRQDDALHRELRLNSSVYTIIGVAPPGFSGASNKQVDVWIPIFAAMRGAPAGWHLRPGMRVAALTARLREGATVEASAAQAGQAIAASGIEGPTGLTVGLAAIIPRPSAAAATPAGRMAFWLGGVSLIVLLISISNIVGLEILRALRQRRETAIKLALGLTPARLLRSLLVESVLMMSVGGLCGVLLAGRFGQAISAFVLPELARPTFGSEGRVLGLAAGIAGLSSILAALVRFAQIRGFSDLSGRRGSSSRRFRRSALQTSLLVGQSALALVLVVGCGLFVSSLNAIESQDLGIDTQDVFLVRLQSAKPLPGTQGNETYRGLMERFRQLPSVRYAAPVQSFPFGPHLVVFTATPGKKAEDLFPGQFPYAYGATDDFFQVLGQRVVQGRLFRPGEAQGGPLVAIVNRSLAEYLWPGQDPIGQCLQAGMASGPQGGYLPADAPCRTVVGVVNDTRVSRMRVEQDPTSYQYYLPYEQTGFMGQGELPFWGVLVKVRSDAASIRSDLLREARGGVQPETFVEVQAYRETIDPQVRPVRLGAGLFSAFGLLALALAGLGLYAALSYAVSQRRQEMGIRLALGAARGDVFRLIVGDGFRIAAMGGIMGCAAALYATRWIAAFLYATSPQNPWILGGGGAALFLVSLLACALPGWKAGRTDPIIALRAE